MPDKRLKAEADSLGVRGGRAYRPRLFEKLFVDVKRLFHAVNVAISIHIFQPYGII